MKLKPPQYVRAVMEKLEKANYECWLVGGCVRDALRGVEPHDYDIACSAKPAALVALFSGVPCLLKGLSHGTVTPIVAGHPVEVTAYRVEGAYSDHRRPDSVRFVNTVEEDLSRRDFTVNAMAYHPRRGLFDPFGGQFDLDQKMIRAVGEPSLRFEEDALRILRGMRFSARLGFSVEPYTAAAMRDKAQTLRLIAAERITAELRAMLESPASSELPGEFFPVFAALFPGLEERDIPALRSAFAAAGGDAGLRLAALALCSDFARWEKLALTRKESKRIKKLCALSALPSSRFSPWEIILTAAEQGVADVADCLLLRSAAGEDTEAAGAALTEALEQRLPLDLADLALSGADLKPLLPPERIGGALKALQRAVLMGACPNRKEALLSYLNQ